MISNKLEEDIKLLWYACTASSIFYEGPGESHGAQMYVTHFCATKYG